MENFKTKERGFLIFMQTYPIHKNNFLYMLSINRNNSNFQDIVIYYE